MDQIVQQAQSFWHQLGVQQSYAGEIATGQNLDF
jgi:hypothetical protein